MANGDSDFTSRMESTWRNWRGEDWTPEKAVQNFQLYGPAKRAAALDQFDEELRNVTEIPNNPTELRKHVELFGLRRRLDEVHHAQIKVNR